MSVEELKNFREVCRGLDPQPLLQQLRYPPEVGPPDYRDWWNYDDSWTRRKDPQRNAIYNEDNIVLRYVSTGIDHETEKLCLSEFYVPRDGWTKPAAHVFTAFKPLVWAVNNAVHGEHIGRIIITRLPPGGVIKTHIDGVPKVFRGRPIRALPYWQRYQVPLQAEPGVMFYCGGENLYLKPGKGYWFNNQLPHSVYNNSDKDRLSMVLEIRPMFP
jgi:hypothetical protein